MFIDEEDQFRLLDPAVTLKIENLILSINTLTDSLKDSPPVGTIESQAKAAEHLKQLKIKYRVLIHLEKQKRKSLSAYNDLIDSKRLLLKQWQSAE